MDSGEALSDRGVGPALRAVIAVLALYALLLQAFLGGLMPLPTTTDGLCAQHSDGPAVPGAPVPHGHGDCCTAAQVTGPALPPRPAAIGVRWAVAVNRHPAWPLTRSVGARAPPGTIASPRGPPTA
ncbi:hypothetical protein LOK46_28125 [Methylobacterium sp. NMS14P]|uniref:hypothetical protein n=1 Tax=Methylobacterium sp. NMS14P TaxID=2894310 RepID=UPI0023583AD0|nr:hypothetical protein [Methylobacterium sp. NMS14P]WCS24945.1 hypothetical protein LOK46_28125 [Methylobacterium sp. NMS14P]